MVIASTLFLIFNEEKHRWGKKKKKIKRTVQKINNGLYGSLEL